MFRILLIITVLLVSSAVDARPRGVKALSAIFNNGGGLNLNVSVPGYSNGHMPFSNWWKASGAITIVSSINGTLTGQQVWDCPTSCSTPTTYLTSEGELITPVPTDVTSFSRIMFSTVFDPASQYDGIANPYLGEQFDITWQGCASPTMSVTGTLGTGGSSSFGANSGTITLGSTNASNVTLTFTMTAPCRADPPVKIVVAQHDYAADAAICNTSVAAIPPRECWDRDWLTDVSPAGIIRFMDFMQTNNSGISDISQLATINYAHVGSPYPGTYINSSSLSGSVLTVGSVNSTANATIRIGSILRDATGDNPTLDITVTSFGTGTGGTGTYNVTCSVGACPALASRDFVIRPPVGSNGRFGAKGGMHPSLACSIGQATNAIIEYPFPVFATNQMVVDVATYFKNCGIRVKYTFSNELFNFGASFIVQFTYAQSFDFASTVTWGGYREAEIFEIIAGIYGTNAYNPETTPPNTTSMWFGHLGSFMATPSVSLSAINGANQWLTDSSSTYTLPKLVRAVDVAPYLGQNNVGGLNTTITNVTAFTTPRVTQANHGFILNQVIKMFVSGGTMASVLNNAYATVTNVVSSSQYDINIDTTGLTYATPGGGQTNWAMDGAWFKLIDESIARNIATPATYPTQYSYFTQQTMLATLTGSASDASWGSLTFDAVTNLSNVAGSVQAKFREHALNINTYGLSVAQYEGGFGTVLAATNWNPAPPQLPEFIAQSQFDAGVVGDTSCDGLPCTITTIYATSYQAFRDIGGIYPSQFLDIGPLSKFGAWGSLRFIPGDESNPKWQAVLTENARGVNVPVYPSAPGTYSYVPPTVANANESTATTTYSFDINIGTGATYISACYVTQSGAATISGFTVGGTSLSLTADAINTSLGIVAIYSGAVPAGAATRTVTLTYGSSAFQEKRAYIYNLSGLANNVADSVTNGTGTTTPIINTTKNSAVIGCGYWLGGTVNWSGGAGSPPVLAPVSQVIGTTRGSSALFNFNFNSQIMPIFMGAGVSGSAIAASYR